MTTLNVCSEVKTKTSVVTYICIPMYVAMASTDIHAGLSLPYLRLHSTSVS